MNEIKTNAMRILDRQRIKYNARFFAVDPDNYVSLDSKSAPEKIGLPAERVFKTIVTKAKSGVNYVFMLPVCCELDLKKCAEAAGEKAVEPLHLKELLPVTGYVRGGCSPIGMKKQFKTIAHFTAKQYATIVFSAGRPGIMIETEPAALVKTVNAEFKDITRE
jgi:hypothetical protein